MPTGLHIDAVNVLQGRDDATNFTAQLLRLIRRADERHLEMIRKVFPNAVRVYEHWFNTEEILDLDYD
ncbi:hypothetical protein ES708_12288 [subsurface metagenome]